MGRRVLATALAFLALAFPLACSSAGPSSTPRPTPQTTPTDESDATTVNVVEVIDGATIRVDTGSQTVTVRYLGIAAPGAAEDGGDDLQERALLFNRHLVQDTAVELEKGVVNVDPFGRLLRYVYVNGEMVNLTLLTNGLATVDSFPPDFEHRTSFLIAEESAKRDQRGLWKGRPAATQEAKPTEVPRFGGGTLPVPPGFKAGSAVCDYSGTSDALIKGNVDSATGEHVYHVPGGFFYETTVVDQNKGDRWLCTEAEAVAAGWKRSKH